MSESISGRSNHPGLLGPGGSFLNKKTDTPGLGYPKETNTQGILRSTKTPLIKPNEKSNEKSNEKGI